MRTIRRRADGTAETANAVGLRLGLPCAPTATGLPFEAPTRSVICPLYETQSVLPDQLIVIDWDGEWLLGTETRRNDPATGTPLLVPATCTLAGLIVQVVGFGWNFPGGVQTATTFIAGTATFVVFPAGIVGALAARAVAAPATSETTIRQAPWAVPASRMLRITHDGQRPSRSGAGRTKRAKGGPTGASIAERGGADGAVRVCAHGASRSSSRRGVARFRRDRETLRDLDVRQSLGHEQRKRLVALDAPASATRVSATVVTQDVTNST
jgi:hypothetical protein